MTLFRHIFRRLIWTPGFTSLALLTLAVGIGANTAIFTVINGVLIKPLPYSQADDKTYAVGQIPPIRRFRFISPGYFVVSGTPLLAGRDFTWTDIYDKRQVAIVSENLAREMWGDPRKALGRRLREGMKDPWREIVGVAGDVCDDGVQQKATAMVYWPAMLDTFYGEMPYITRGGTFFIRTTRAGTKSFLAEARKAIWSVNPNLPVFLVQTLKDVQDRSMARTSFTLVMLAIAGAMLCYWASLEFMV